MTELESRKSQCERDISKLQKELEEIKAEIEKSKEPKVGDIYVEPGGTKRMYCSNGTWVFLSKNCRGILSLLDSKTIMNIGTKVED